jgi:hypothetical protein
MSITIRRSLILVVSLLVVTVGLFVAQRAGAASSTPVVYVATGEDFPDALGAASAAAVQSGPVLLVQKDSIPAVTAAELSRLSPDVIYVAGGTAVVSDAVFNALKAYAGSVVRVAGANRYSTAVEVSKSAFPVTGGGSTAALEAQVAALSAEVDALQAMLAGVSRNGSTLMFTGMNLQVVNGQSSTATANSVGNIIIGYNEQPSSTPAGYRAGSHYLIIGGEHTYTSFGGIIVGRHNKSHASYASVTGGIDNTASGFAASVTGGNSNIASGPYSLVSGGVINEAIGTQASVTGGRANEAISTYASVSGGYDNTASGQGSSVSGGERNTATGDCSSVVGGDDVYLTSGSLTCRTAGEGFWNATD